MTDSSPSRIALLRDRVEAAEASSTRATFDVPFRQRQRTLVKIEVPLFFPLYNVRSGRTHRSQAEWVEENGQTADFFADPEDGEVQGAQHQLLLTMIHEQGLATDLERRNQTNPIVLTFDGYIVDGNRRVASLRDQGGVENVIAVVLPRDATMSEVFETELELQMARETRADYNWIDRALHVRYGVEQLNEQVRSIAHRMNIQEGDVNDVLARLVLVDLYLDWAGCPDAYHRVPSDSEQSFIELHEREGRQQFRSLPALQRDAIRLACFGVIQSAGGGYMAVRQVADIIRNKPTEVVTRLRDRLPPDLAQRLDLPVETQSHDQPNDILSQLALAFSEPGVSPGAELLNVVRDPSDARHSIPVLMDVAQELIEEEREVLGHREPLRKLERALLLLRSVHITADTQQRPTLCQLIAQLIVEAERIADEAADDTDDDA